MKKIVLVGYGGHAQSVLDSIITTGQYEVVGYTDIENRNADGLEYLGTDDQLESLFKKGIHDLAFGMGYIGKFDIRDKIYDFAKKIGFTFPVIIDPGAVLAKSAVIGEGTFIGKKAVVNSNARIGKLCIINTGAIIEHENIVGDHSHIAVGATLCGKVRIGTYCFVGANATVIQGIHIRDYSLVGAGPVVITNIEGNCTVAGNPAKILQRGH